MRQIAHSQIEQLSLEFTNPKKASWLMRDYLSNTIRKTNQVLTRNLLSKLKAMKVGFVEVEDIADHMLNQQKRKNKKRDEKYKIVKDLMKHKMLDVLICIKEMKKNLQRSKENLSKVVRLNTAVRREFMELVNIEVNKMWKDGKDKNKNKAENLVKKFTKEEPSLEIFEGVAVGDDILEKIEKKNCEIPNIKDNKPIIYGGIDGLTVEQEEILKLPPNHQTFPNLNLENFETELEKCMIKAKWEKIREESNNEKRNKENETGETIKEPTEVLDKETKTIDFRNLKATDLKNNKRVIIPDVDDEDEEIRRNHVKRELKGVFVNYMKDHCDKYGNVLENNLSKTKLKAIKELNQKMDEEKMICFETDKTGHLTLDTQENFVKKMGKHIKNDDVVSMKEVRKI